MKPHCRNPLFALSLVLTLALPASRAATLTWDVTPGDGAAITAGGGDWNTTATNWNNAGVNEAWSQTSETAASNAAVFAGSDGILDEYVVTLSGTVNAQSVTFNNSGYRIEGGTLILRPTSTTNGGITVAANKTATIQSALSYSNNAPVTNVINAGATLHLGGGASNSQYTFNGAGSVHITGGNYEANVGAINVGSFNLSGGTYNLTPGASNGYTFGNAVARNVNVNVSSAGTLTLNHTETNTAAVAPFLAIGNNTNSLTHTTSLTVQTGGTVTVGTRETRAAEIRISNSGNANGLLDVQGGTVHIGAGNANNRIYLFKNGSTDGYTAKITQSGGTMTANGIQFGGSSGTYQAGSAASLTLSGGSLYIGAQGITRGSGAADLPTTIKLEGGTLGADASWSSSLDMQLGTAGGGVTFSAQNAVGGGRSITLSGNLSDVPATSGSLIKAGVSDMILSGSNTYSGGTTVQAGRLFINSAGALPATGAVAVHAGTLALNASGNPTFAQSITLHSGSNLSLRSAATLSNVTLASSGILTFNQDDVTTNTFTLNSATALTGELTLQAGGGSGSAGTVTLSGIFSGSGGSLVKTGPGTLALGGANTFDGGITLRNGTVNAITNDAALGAGTVTMGGAGSTGASLLTGRTLANPITVNAPDSGALVIGANGGGSGYTLSGGITLNGDLTIRTFNNNINGTVKAQGTLTGGITGSGNVTLDNLGLAANALIFNTGAINHAGSLTLQGTATGDTTINAGIGANVTSVVQNSATSRMVLAGINAYTGDTLVNAGEFVLSEGGRMRFNIGESGVNNRISGTASGNVTMDGIFEFDLTLAGNGLADAWDLVELASLGSASFGPTFAVADFTNAGGGLWNRNFGGTDYQFDTSSGTLSVIPEPGMAVLAALGLGCLIGRRRRE